jgi:hypothetical protein
MADEFFYGKCRRLSSGRAVTLQAFHNFRKCPCGFSNKNSPLCVYVLQCPSSSSFLFFFSLGVTLKEQKAEVVWNPESAAEELEYVRANKLIVKQILLGVEAKADEYNVVEVCQSARSTHTLSHSAKRYIQRERKKVFNNLQCVASAI